MNKHDGKQYLALSALYASIIFLALIVSIMVSGLLLFFLVDRNVIMEKPGFVANAKHMIFSMGIISVFVGPIIALMVSRVTLKPIKRMIVQIKRLAKGDFSVRINFGRRLGRHPVFKEFSESFNVMAEELEHTEILRSDFINNFSHEFKTPIVSIAGFAKLLKKGNLTEEETKEYLDIIEEEALRLADMASNVMDLTRVENQIILTDVSSFNLSEQIRSCVLLLENRWMKKNIEFDLEFGEYEIWANEEMLKQMWINLIDNAIKFSPEYGLVTIKITDTEGCYRISLSNIGEEIPEKCREKIFDKFYQADESHSTKGNGIGLAIVKRVTELHQGSVHVECKNEINTFIIEIPKIK